MRLARTHPELFGSQVLGVALLCTSAGELADHSPIRGIPGRPSPGSPSRRSRPEPDSRTLSHRDAVGSDLGYVVTRRLAFGSDVPAGYVDFASEMLAEIPLEVVADYYPASPNLTSITPSRSSVPYRPSWSAARTT